MSRVARWVRREERLLVLGYLVVLAGVLVQSAVVFHGFLGSTGAEGPTDRRIEAAIEAQRAAWYARLDEADGLALQGRRKDAVRVLEALLEDVPLQNPRTPTASIRDAAHRRLMALAVEDRDAAAVNRAGRALVGEHPGRAADRLAYGRALLEVLRPERAEVELRAACRLAPANHDAMAAYVGFLVDGGRRREARDLVARYERAFLMGPEGECRLGSGRWSLRPLIDGREHTYVLPVSNARGWSGEGTVDEITLDLRLTETAWRMSAPRIRLIGRDGKVLRKGRLRGASWKWKVPPDGRFTVPAPLHPPIDLALVDRVVVELEIQKRGLDDHLSRAVFGEKGR